MDYNPIKLDQASDAPVDIHKYKAITIYPFIQWSRNNIYRIICIDEPVANCFSLSLSLFQFSNYENEEIHKRMARKGWKFSIYSIITSGLFSSR